MRRKIFYYNAWLYLLIIVVLVQAVDWRKCTVQRGRYLLGIFYNGHFENRQDGQVYQDFLKRHGLDHESFTKIL